MALARSVCLSGVLALLLPVALIGQATVEGSFFGVLALVLAMTAFALRWAIDVTVWASSALRV